MAAPTDTFIDPADGAANGNDHGGNAFIDGVFNSGAPNQLTKIGAFTAATCQAGDKIYLDDNGSGEVTAGLYTISTRDDNDNVTLTADIRSGAPEPTDVRCDNHTGAVGLPWATAQHALDFTTRDAANGDRFNVKAGTDDVLAAALDVTGTYGTPTAAAPWICQGYTNAAGDGGIGGISGAANFGIMAAALNYVAFADMHLHNTGAVDVVQLNTYCSVINCEIDNTTGDAIQVANGCTIVNCYIHNIDARGIYSTTGSAIVVFNTFENETNDFTDAIFLKDRGVACFNIIDIDGASEGIVTESEASLVMFNSIYANAGTATGIRNTTDSIFNVTIGNIVEGFSGIGGDGITLAAQVFSIYGHNAFYNNTANLTDSSELILDDLTANDVILTASAFIDAANDDFRIKPSAQALGYPTGDYPNLSVRGYFDMGALQRMSQMLTHPGMAGGARG